MAAHERLVVREALVLAIGRADVVDRGPSWSRRMNHNVRGTGSALLRDLGQVGVLSLRAIM